MGKPGEAAGARVSVIVAVKDGERFLAEALDSVLAQDRKAHEIIVVDGRSTDSTVEIAARYPAVRTITQPGTGIADAYNAGINAAEGELIAFLSHDDLWTSDKLSVQVAAMESDSDLQYVTARATFFLEDENYRPPGLRPELLEGSHVAHIMETLLARKEAFTRVGAFDESLSTAEDVDWFARAGDLGVPARIVQKALLRKRIYGGNISFDVEANNRNLLQALRKSLARKRDVG